MGSDNFRVWSNVFKIKAYPDTGQIQVQFRSTRAVSKQANCADRRYVLRADSYSVLTGDGRFQTL